MNTPTTDAQKYDAATLAAQAEARLRNQCELTQAAVNLSNHWLAQRTELMGRINRAKQIGHAALNDIEGGHVEALAGAIQDMLTMLEGDK